jgi:gentisate 1,2-dioxygenase
MMDSPSFLNAAFRTGTAKPGVHQTGCSSEALTLGSVDLKRSAKVSPVFNYPYAETRRALEQMKLQQEWDSCHGLKLRYTNPVTGDFAMPS